MLDIKDAWKLLDKSMCIYPNGLKEHGMVELSFFLPEKRKLIENKDKEVDQQECHLQAKTIKTKLDSVICLLKFLVDRIIIARFSTWCPI